MQGRFKRDGNGSPQARKGRGEAAADPELRGGTDHASPPPRAQGNGPAGGGAPSDRDGQAPGGDAPDGGKTEAPKGSGGSGSRISLRNMRISTRLVSLLALPVIAATSLGALRIEYSLDNIDQLDKMQLLTEMTQRATALADALQAERDRSAGPLAGSGDTKDDTNVVAPRQATDNARDAFNKATTNIQGDNATMVGVRATVLEIGRQLNTLNEIRGTAYTDAGNLSQTVNGYNQLITSLLSLSQDMAQATSNPEMIQSTRALAAFSSAKEYASMQRALISAGLAHKGGAELSANDRLAGRTAENDEKAARERFSQIYTNNASALTRGLDGTDNQIKSAVAFTHRAFATDSGIRSQDYKYLDWYDTDSVKIDEMSRIETSLLSEMQQTSRELRNDATQDAIINGAVVLLVLGVSLVGAFVVARSMVLSLRRLQSTAQRVAQERLPELVKQLSEADPQDVDTSVESVGVHSRDEIGKVAAAFDDVHREAVRLASEQALLRGNVNAMFTNLSRRSQGLIQRQLSLISELEAREADPDQLSSLFKLDHLATRMRRNGENLLVLAGEEPGRRWTRPVPLVDVLRAAASEVEQYERIELSSVPQTEVAGRVVNDLVHLLAELLENATSFSSPQTKVKVTGHALPDGRVLVEIHDTGIGLSPEDLSAINERLASPPTVDVSVSRRMGLFVVGRLSLRHGIRIQLRPSDSGGTTALVMLPVDLAQGGKKPAPSVKAPGEMGGGQTSRLAGLQPRGQVGSGPAAGARPALPGRGGPGGGAANTFGAPAPAGRTNPPGAPAPGDARPAAPRPDDGRPALPTRGSDTGTSAPGTVAPPTGAPRRDERPQLPSRGAPAELPGGAGGTGGAGLFGGQSSQGGQGSQESQGGRTGQPGQPVQDVFGGQDGFGGRSAFGGQGTQDGRSAQGDPDSRRDQAGQAGPAGQQPGTTSWGARRERGGSGDDWPVASRDTQDRPRGHEEPESTGSFERPAPGGGPGDTAAFARPDFNGPPPGEDGSQTGRGARQDGRGSGDTGGFALPAGERGAFEGGAFGGAPRHDGQGTGEFARPAEGHRVPQGGYPGGPGDTGEFALPGDGQAAGQGIGNGPGDTGQFARPNGGTGQFDTGQFPQTGTNTGQFDTGQFPQAGGNTGQYDTGQFPQADANTGQYDTGQHPRPDANTGRYDTGQYDTGQFPQAGGTGQFPALDSTTGQFPHPDAERAAYGDAAQSTGQFPAPQPQDGLPSADVLGSADAGPGDGRTPIFDTIESDWFTTPAAAAAGVPPQQPQQPQQPAEEPDVPLMPRRASAPADGASTRPTSEGPGAPGQSASKWRASPNDEQWRQAEQIRQPAAGGVTTSGLPRRVPRANLVAGTAQQQSTQTGPQVSRAPSDVRGRLTNLRRGIQQGRQAGGTSSTGNHGIVDPTHQQER
ncbi:nitrate- and nitrite sensing domain-containing protein [Streptomyces kasugaensis]|uniref:sensor histidine kinase n=1 Tax=Streptomyces TaxID=1883 RepID=UPI000B9E7707